MSSNVMKEGMIKAPSRALRLAVALALGGAVSGAAAEYTILESGGLKANVGFEAGLYGVYSSDVFFGAGRPDLDGDIEDDVENVEFYIKPNLNFTFDFPTHGQIYGKTSFVGAVASDRDPGGYSTDDGEIGVDDAYLGWRGDHIDVSVGRQRYIVGNQFLIGWGHFENSLEGGNYFQAPWRAFEMTAIGRASYDPVLVELFYLKGDQSYFGSAALGGMNVEYAIGEEGAGGTLGAMLMKVTDVSAANLGGGRVGRETINFRGLDIAVPMVPGLSFSAEYALQVGDNDAGTDYDAYAWYFWPKYAFENVAWVPTIELRYGEWSGDDPNTADNEAFDALFFYASGWGSWFQGEVAGEYLFVNSNQKTFMAALGVSPWDTVSAKFLYYNTRFDDKGSAGVTSSAYLDEINFIVDWLPNDSWYVGAGIAYAMPGTGGNQLVGGNDDDWLVVQGQVIYYY